MSNRYAAERRAAAERARFARIDTPERPVLNLAELQELVCAEHASERVRDPETFRLRKTDDERVVTLALAKHVYGRYKVPYHLERIWYAVAEQHARARKGDRANDNHQHWWDRRQQQAGAVLSSFERKRRIAWYVCAATGGSLHKQHCKDFFTKRETHAFLTAPGQMTFVEALWYAVASSYTDDHGLRQRIMRSKVAREQVTPFWKEAARFFIEHDTPFTEIGPFVDFFQYRLNIDRGYSLRGRTPQSLARARADWHRTLSRVRDHGGGAWEGVAVPDYFIGRPLPEGLPSLAEQQEWVRKVTNSEQYTIRQIRTGDALAEEGSAMRHCVYSYKDRCIRGTASIWSMRRNDRRLLTIEMNNEGDLVQIRGVGNRLATDAEMAIIKRWARDAGLRIVNRGW